ncbi:MAG TPA: hypothetical protein VME43_16890 [Bryobacteraceae bacterium]|nr:hypothetical protein [Bryobacteraceae bacterium]
MIANHSDLPAKSTGAAATASAVSPCYLAAPALPDVLNEQMAFLLEHAGHNAAGCADCLRLAQVVRLLMRPFE